MAEAESVEGIAEKVSEFMTKVQPYWDRGCEIYDEVEPYVEKAVDKAQELWKKLEPYHPEEFFPVVAGLILVFFGGTYMTVLACVEAYRIVGWKETADALKVLHSNYMKAMDANRKDNAADADGDGIADVKQIDSAALASRKLQLLMKATDPNQLDKAFTAILTGFTAVVASVRIKFAKAITLGITIADIIEDNLEKYLAPLMDKLVPAEYHKWLPLSRKYASRFVGISIAWWLARLVSALHSAVRGATLVVSGVTGYVIRHGYVDKRISKHAGIFQLLMLAIALVGFWMQLRGGFSVSFPMNVILFPVSMAEWFLQYIIGSEAA